MRTCLMVLLLLPMLAQGQTAPPSTDQLAEKIRTIAETARGRVGVMATVIETGQSVSLNPDGHFPMQSVYKFPIAMAVLHQVDQGKLRLDQKVKVEKSDFVGPKQHSPIRDAHPEGVELTLAELLRLMVSESDGTACDVLLAQLGGPYPVTEYLRTLSVNGVMVRTTEKEMGENEAVQYRNWASPESMVRLLTVFHEGKKLSEASTVLLRRWLTETPTGPHRLKGLLPAGTVVAHKTGSSRTFDGFTRATNDVGIITLPTGQHAAIAVFVADSKAPDADRENVIAQVARVVWDEWSGLAAK
ncbi:class A beta-lactamase, subclass A2 [Larkinella sp. VNQ87]|uniref:class A beta-lactamase, subclass A2 n=1 Tax=Larkinella sp. VNQ87 TaxID=3400921 RepID=UPI003C005134